MDDFLSSYYFYSPKNDTDMQGIIYHNPSIEVQAIASSVWNSYNSTYGPQNAINLSSPNHWESENTQFQWIIINFPKHCIFITHYGVQSTNCGGADCYHAKMWKVFGLLGHEWIEIDEVLSSQIRGAFLVENRPVSGNGPFSSFKFVSTGPNWNPSEIYHYFRFLNIEFFGLLMPRKNICNTIYNQNLHLCNFSLLMANILALFMMHC